MSWQSPTISSKSASESWRRKKSRKKSACATRPPGLRTTAAQSQALLIYRQRPTPTQRIRRLERKSGCARSFLPSHGSAVTNGNSGQQHAAGRAPLELGPSITIVPLLSGRRASSLARRRAPALTRFPGRLVLWSSISGRRADPTALRRGVGRFVGRVRAA